MKAIILQEFGGSDTLHVADVPRPEPKAEEILIRVSHAGVNPVDWKIREGYLQTMFPHRFPLIPGWDAAGTVESLGSSVQGFALGDRVYAYCRKPEVQWGTYAEFVAMRADAVAKIPDTLAFDDAAGIPLVGLTSWQVLFDTAQLRPGQTVLIHAGAGGLGSLAIQFAKHAGARVIVTASAANHDYVRALGADDAIDYTSEDFTAAVRARHPQGIDLVFATVGGKVLEDSYAVLAKGGMLVSVVGRPSQEDGDRWGVRLGYVFVSPNGDQLREIASLVERGKVRLPAKTVLPLDDAAKAQDLSRAGKTRGKVVLAVG